MTFLFYFWQIHIVDQIYIGFQNISVFNQNNINDQHSPPFQHFICCNVQCRQRKQVKRNVHGLQIMNSFMYSFCYLNTLVYLDLCNNKLSTTINFQRLYQSKPKVKIRSRWLSLGWFIELHTRLSPYYKDERMYRSHKLKLTQMIDINCINYITKQIYIAIARLLIYSSSCYIIYMISRQAA